VLRPAPAHAAPVTRPREQYLVSNIAVIVDNGVTVALPPIYNDVITAKLKSGRRWTTSALKNAQSGSRMRWPQSNGPFRPPRPA
jgi:hypothetical protein